MNFSLPEEDNFKITDNYYSIIKQISEDLIKYITNFKSYSNDYLKKISSNNEKYNIQALEKKYKEMGMKDLDLKHIISISSILSVVIEQQIINLEFFIKGIDEKIINFEKIFNEKSSLYLEQYNHYKEVKTELNKKYRDIERLKVNYISNISSVEDMIHKFYMKKNINKKRINSFSSPSPSELKKENNNNVSIEEQVNNSIQKVKKIEEDYKTNIALVKTIEEKYTKVARESKVNIRKALCELLNGYKELIFDSLLFLKNCYKLPLSEVDIYMNDILKLDECVNFDKIITSSYKPSKDLTSINPKKYTLKFFQKNKNSNNNLKTYKGEDEENEEENKQIKRSKSSSNASEGFDEMDFIQEQEIFMTIKKMMENFELLNSNNYDINLEEEKLRCKYLTLKILSFAPVSKLYSDKIPSITDEEVLELKNMIDKKTNRVIFIQKLSQFRTRGIFEIPDREFKILSEIFNKIVKIIESDIDYDSAINIIILSQTYYIIKDGKKEYLQKEIMNNELFKSKKFWETYANYSITKEISNCVIGDNAEDHDIEESYSNIVFAQLLPITDNMIEFGLDINIVEDIILPFIKRYNISEELAMSIISVIDAKKSENNNNSINININNIDEKKDDKNK